MKLSDDNRFWYLVLASLFLFGIISIVIGFDIYNGIIIVGFVLIVTIKLFEKYIKERLEGKKVNPYSKSRL